MSSLLGAIEALVQRKADLLNQVSEIDRELERAKLALSGRPAEPAKHFARDVRLDGSMANRIFAVLDAGEPRTTEEIARGCDLSVHYAGLLLKEMARTGQLHRTRLKKLRGAPCIWARTKAALVTVQSPPADDDELGPQNPVSTDGEDAALSTSATDGVQ